MMKLLFIQLTNFSGSETTEQAARDMVDSFVDVYKRQAAQRVDADAEFRGHLPAGPPLLGDHPHCPRLEGLIVTRRRWVLSFFG